MLSASNFLPSSTADIMLHCEEPQLTDDLEFASKDDQRSPTRSVSPVMYGPLVNHHMSVDTGMSTKDVQDPTAVHGSCGLWNIGNTCFMNAGIQSLASCAPLLKFFFEKFHFHQGMQDTLTGAFYILLCKMWSGQYSVVCPQNFKALLGLYHPQFRDYRQHDCQEFLALLLDTLHEQLNQVPSICVMDTSAGGKSGSPDDQDQNLLNNQDGASEGQSNVGDAETSQTSPNKLKPLHVESAAAGEEDVSGSQGEASPGSLSPGMLAESGHTRSSLKRMSATAEPSIAGLISEDSNHSSVSIHSTDSEQSSAFKKLKIESEASGMSCHFQVAADKLSSASTCSEVPITHVPRVTTCSPLVSASVPARNTTSEAAFKPLDASFSGYCKSAETKLLKPTISVCSGESGTHYKRVSQDFPHFSPEGDGIPAHTFHTGTSDCMDTSSCCPSEKQLEPDVSSSSSLCQVNPEPKGPTTVGSPQLLPCLEDYYCKETKTLNTNVLVSSYLQGDIAVDSEKFAKVDNLTQVPAMKEVNLLQEALQDMEDDKVEKTLIGKTLSTKRSNVTAGTSGSQKASNSANLRVVKTRNTAVLRKTCQNLNVLNNSYDFDDDMIGLPRTMEPAVQKEVEGKTLGSQCGTPGGQDPVKMMAMAAEMTPLEVEKNVQMQALSKFNTNIIKSNIREDLSDRASPSGSTETEEADMEAEVESTEEEEDEEEEEEAVVPSSTLEESRALPNPARCFTSADVAAANNAWEEYKTRNNSIIVDTFQGQFKSTVVCSECSHVSVTYEPFMYLSLPIPHAMDRQISVVFIRPYKLATRYLVTLHKNDKVQRLRQHLQTMTGTEGSDVILTEVLDNHVSRILDDNILVRYVNDSSRSIYAFEMLPPPAAVMDMKLLRSRSSPELHHAYANGSSVPTNTHLEREHCASLRTATVTGPVTIDTLDAELVKCSDHSERCLPHRLVVDSLLTEVFPSDATVNSTAATVSSQSEGFADDMQPDYVDSSQIGTGLWEWTNGETVASSSNPDGNISVPPSSPASLAPAFQVHSDLNSDACEGEFAAVLSSETVGIDDFHTNSDFFTSRIWSDNRMSSGEPSSLVASPNTVASAGSGAGIADQWRTCAICLEEMVDSELLTHAVCAGVFCHNCLEMSVKHSGELAECCPVCLAPTDVTEDFVPLASSSNAKSKVRILAVPVTFRCEHRGSTCDDYDGSGVQFELICSPRIIYVASKQDASSVFSQVDRVLPANADYRLYFTDGQGLHCSRCEYAAHCTGCEVAREGDITMQPGDNLAVHFTEGLPPEMDSTCFVEEDQSMKSLRSREPISIFDCFDAFTQSEVLDETNPWYCPCCCRNQCAKKTMTVWRYPDSLIIHLKRFVFEDLSSTKIDNRVVFPHTNLDVTSFLSGPSVSLNAYDLYSVVCHYGGANSGHYTAFTCHPLTSEWYQYNDECVSPMRPSENEFDSCYVLCYQRKGTCKEFNLVKDLPAMDENADHLMSPGIPLTLEPACSLPASPSSTAVVDTSEENSTLQIPVGALSKQTEADTTYDFYN